MKNKIMKIGSALGAYMYLLAAKANAADTPWKGTESVSDNDQAKKILAKIASFVKPVAAILVFASVLLIGFEIIMKRNKADERMESMSSLMWVGIGTLVIAFAALIATFLIGSAASESGAAVSGAV